MGLLIGGRDCLRRSLGGGLKRKQVPALSRRHLLSRSAMAGEPASLPGITNAPVGGHLFCFAERMGQVSNLFVKDLVKIADFLLLLY